MKKANEISLCAILIALALALSYTERLIPLQLFIPLPGIKIGLANVVTLLALCLLKKRFACMVLLCRCIFGAVFGGGITGFAFSMCGGFLALGVMVAAEKASIFSVFGISVLGASAHNIGQILISMVLMRSLYIGAYLPYLLITAVITGLLTGSLCAGVLRVLPKATKVPQQIQR